MYIFNHFFMIEFIGENHDFWKIYSLIKGLLKSAKIIAKICVNVIMIFETLDT